MPLVGQDVHASPAPLDKQPPQNRKVPFACIIAEGENPGVDWKSRKFFAKAASEAREKISTDVPAEPDQVHAHVNVILDFSS